MSGPTIDGIKLDTLPTMRDARGALTVAEFSKFVPFPVARMFYVREVPPGTMRGQHAHYRCSQYMICISGRLRITVDDGANEWFDSQRYVRYGCCECFEHRGNRGCSVQAGRDQSGC